MHAPRASPPVCPLLPQILWPDGSRRGSRVYLAASKATGQALSPLEEERGPPTVHSVPVHHSSPPLTPHLLSPLCSLFRLITFSLCVFTRLVCVWRVVCGENAWLKRLLLSSSFTLYINFKLSKLQMDEPRLRYVFLCPGFFLWVLTIFVF